MAPKVREPFHPLLKASEIEDSMDTFPHFLDAKAIKSHSYMSDILGLKGLGVVKVNLPAGNNSCTPHYHLNTAEWLYILKGTGHLILIDASTDCPPFKPDSSKPLPTTAHVPKVELPTEEREVGPGDFIGLPGGTVSARWTHTLRAGQGGLEYLMGGERAVVDVVGYPT
ncbi:hypothetical protein BCR39DRAFT_378931 [Naematelia encephala]|uniref:Cupin type-1 domain-containing protein n=1 Tax=Naematelia encephala TaxID=71784 RepID=A0A1Y2BCM4_9TREE|nr:hypothetical protein BCR39DRAFT_378931 [Naematelia encephala]